MQKSIVLLASLLFLASCSMDGGLPQTPAQPVSQKEVQKETTATQTGIATGTVTKDFGSGFTLTQNTDQTELTYSGKVIKIWAHTPSSKFEFTRLEPCKLMIQRPEWNSSYAMNQEKESELWAVLSEQEKRTCTAEHMWTNVRVSSTPNPRFFRLYGWLYSPLFDTQTGKIYQSIIQENIQDIIFVDGHILFLTRSNFDASDELLIFSENFEFQKKWISQYKDGRTSIEKIENMSQTGITLILKEFNYTTSKESSRKEMISF